VSALPTIAEPRGLVAVDAPQAALAALDRQVVQALDSGDRSQLDLLGYGEVSCVLALEVDGVRYACKRLPPFSSWERLGRYREVLDRYVEKLAERGITVVPTRVQGVQQSPEDGGQLIGWVVQPMLPEGSLLTHRLAHPDIDKTEAVRLFGLAAEKVTGAIHPYLGLDSQLSNWALVGDQLYYLDLTTPMMRDDDGNEQLDADLFLAAMPWLLRGFVRLFMLKSVINTFYAPRSALVDCLGNLVKERLDHILPALCDHASTLVEAPITEAEVRRFYKGDARTWELLLRLRRMDRWWQRKVRRRRYPFLLPDGIQR